MLSNVLKISSNFVHSNLSVFSRNLTCSPILNSMPAKKRRKIDPAVLKAREEKRKKRLAKALKKMEKKQRIMRPMTEIEPNPILLKEREKRARNIEISEEIEEERIELFKEWSRFANQRHKKGKIKN